MPDVASLCPGPSGGRSTAGVVGREAEEAVGVLLEDLAASEFGQRAASGPVAVLVVVAEIRGSPSET
jgi:hypothetical protein